MMTTHVLLNTIGLSLDLLGVVLLFFYGISPMIDAGGNTFIITGGIDEKEVKKANKYKMISRIGLVIIILGFAFQLFGNFTT